MSSASTSLDVKRHKGESADTVCRLAIEIPVSLPPPSPSKSTLITSETKALKYKSVEGEAQTPQLELTLTVLPGSSHRIPFRVELASPLLDDTLQMSVGLCKHTWTKGIHTSVGSDKGHDFPGIMVGSVKLDKTSERGTMDVVSKSKEGWVVEGEYVVEEDSVTASGCAIRLSVSIRQWDLRRL